MHRTALALTVGPLPADRVLHISPINDLIVPESLTNWDFFFDSKYSPLGSQPPSSLAGFTNAATKERVRFDEVKEVATLVSTALVKKYGLQTGDTVSLFSPNTVWYPVAMFAATRVGEGPVYLPLHSQG